MYQEHYRATESNGHNTDVGAEEDDDEDSHELQRERVEMVRISGRGFLASTTNPKPNKN